MATEKLFKKDVYMRSAETQISSIKEHDGKLAATFCETVFFPTGGGQPCDLGIISLADGSTFKVTDVYEYDGEIYHEIERSGDRLPEAGDRVKLEIDWQRRFDNMQRHCGEHILSGIFYREYGGVNRGFHMGDDYMTIDISLEEDPAYTTVTWEMAENAERLTNEVIWQDLPMLIRHFDTYEEAENEPMRKKLAIEKDITLVGIESRENGWSCVACCGTHPARTGQVGMVKITKVEPNKGMFRIYFEAGKRAFLNYQKEFDVLTELSNKLSAGTDDVLDKYGVQQEKNRASREQLHLLKKSVLAKEARELSEETAEIPVRAYSLFTLDDLTALARDTDKSRFKLVMMLHEPTNTVLLASDGRTDCGKLVRENASIYNGKGGGNATLARAIFSKREYADTFIELIEKHLR